MNSAAGTAVVRAGMRAPNGSLLVMGMIDGRSSGRSF
jgi:hypothetical protein